MARKINVKLILQLHDNGMKQREITDTRKMSRTSVSKVLKIAEDRNIHYQDIADMNDDVLYKMFFPDVMSQEDIYELPDYDYVHKELKRTGVTLTLLYKEYCDKCREHATIAVGRTKYFDDYRKYCSKQEIIVHKDHTPGARCEVDWSGPTMKIFKPDTGEIIKVYLFVSCLSYSRYAYVEPTLDMKMDTWIRCNVHMYEAFGGVPIRTVCDNLKTGVVKHPKEGDIVLTNAYESMGLHYVTAIMPADVRKPKDKPSVEGTVGNIATDIIARLRNKVFNDFPSLQEAVNEALDDYNNKPFKNRQGSRALIHQEELEYLRPLPPVPYEFKTLVQNRKVHPNCHISLLKNWYSVPYIYRGEKVDVYYTDKIVEIYHDGQRIASHTKYPDYVTNRYSTHPEEMPDKFNQPEMDKERICSWASSIGPNTLEVVERIFRGV